MINIKKENLIALKDVPSWHKKILKNRVHRSTVHRWRIKGIRGVKLESIMIGGKRYTSEEALHRFVLATTAADEQRTVVNIKDKAYLASQGVSLPF